MAEIDLVEPMAREALAVAERSGDVRSEHLVWHFLADCALIRGEFAAALPRYRRSLELAVELVDRAEIAPEIQGVAMVLANCGQAALALRLASTAQAEFDSLGIDFSGILFWNALLKRHLGHARSALGDEAANAAWEHGRCTAFESAIAFALGEEAQSSGQV